MMISSVYSQERTTKTLPTKEAYGFQRKETENGGLQAPSPFFLKPATPKKRPPKLSSSPFEREIDNLPCLLFFFFPLPKKSNPLAPFMWLYIAIKWGLQAWLANCCWRGGILAGACMKKRLVTWWRCHDSSSAVDTREQQLGGWSSWLCIGRLLRGAGAVSKVATWWSYWSSWLKLDHNLAGQRGEGDKTIAFEVFSFVAGLGNRPLCMGTGLNNWMLTWPVMWMQALVGMCWQWKGLELESMPS